MKDKRPPTTGEALLSIWQSAATVAFIIAALHLIGPIVLALLSVLVFGMGK